MHGKTEQWEGARVEFRLDRLNLSPPGRGTRARVKRCAGSLRWPGMEDTHDSDRRQDRARMARLQLGLRLTRVLYW